VGVKLRKISIRVLAGLLVMMTVALTVRAILNYTTGKRLEKCMAQAKFDGVPLRVKDMIPDCPNQDNGARLWRAAEALLLLENQDKSLLGNTTKAFFYGQPFDSASRQQLNRLAEKNRRAIDLVIEAATQPCFRYRTWDNPVYEPNIPNAINMIQAARLLAIDAVLRADKGEIKQALDECQSGIRFVQKTLDEPVLLDALVATGLRKFLQISFDRIAVGRDLDAATLAAWVNEMGPDQWRSRFIRCIPGERALGIGVWLEVMKGSPEVVKDFYGPGIFRRAIGWLLRPLFKSQVLWAMSHYPDLEKISLRPYYEQREWFGKHVRKDGSVSWHERLLEGLLPQLGSLFMKEATLEAMMLATRSGLACKIYKNHTGHYPENLEALVPDILPEVPIDPFTGKALIYKIQNGELLIYSLGSNQKDDGGRSTYEFTKMVMEKDDDWTWREKINP
jgi:hypothetical protein